MIFRKIPSEFFHYLQRYSSFFVRNGTSENSLPFVRIPVTRPLTTEWVERNACKINGKRYPIWLLGKFGKSLSFCSDHTNRIFLPNDKRPKSIDGKSCCYGNRDGVEKSFKRDVIHCSHKPNEFRKNINEIGRILAAFPQCSSFFPSLASRPLASPFFACSTDQEPGTG